MREMKSETGENLRDNQISNKIAKMHKNGKISKAIEMCQSALQQDPTNAELHIRLGDLYLEKHLDIYQPQQFLDEAVNEYQRALESDLNSAEIHYKLGVAFYHKGDLDRSQHHIGISLEYDEKSYAAYFMMARVMIKKGRLAETEVFLRKSINYGKLKSSRAHYSLFNLMKLKGQRAGQNFISIYNQLFWAICKLPFDIEAQKETFQALSYLKFLPLFVKGYYYEKSRDIYQAIDLYIDSVEKTPGLIPLYLKLGNAYRLVGRLSDAINEYKMAIWLDQTNVHAYKHLCSLYEEQGDYESAIDIYKKLIEMQPNDAIYHSNLANIYYLKGDLKEAISHYQTAISLNPNNNWTSIIAQTLGYIFHESKDNYDAAISAYQNASQLNPEDIDIYISLGSAFYDKGDYSNALATYRLAIEVDPNNARIHCNLGFLLWGRGMIEEAVKEYEKAIKLDHNYDIAHNNLGVIYLDDLGYIDKAIECLKNAIQCNGNYALAHYNLGRAMAIKGDNIEAARLLQVSLELNAHTQELDDMEIRMKINELFD